MGAASLNHCDILVRVVNGHDFCSVMWNMAEAAAAAKKVGLEGAVHTMSVLQEITAQALTRGAEYPAVEWEGRWIYWDEMRRVAERVRALVDASGADPRARVAMLPRSRPGPVAALLGLIAAGRNISMIHVYQSPEGVARDIARLKPA